jgi:sigma-54 dependent transcriptional regulator, acetoin dehydrogenase operon transcriptional activator AcoR
MKPPNRLARHAEFARLLLAAAPWGILVVDAQGRTHAVNDLLRRTFDLSPETEILAEDAGAFAGLIPSRDSCSDESPSVRREGVARDLGMEAIRRNRPRSARSGGAIRLDGRRREISILMTAVPMECEGERFAAVLFQDIGDPRGIAEEPETDFRGIVGRDPAMRDLFETIRNVAPTTAPVLIQGESGTGKELVARAIHRESLRAEAHFVPFNCGALPEGLAESELFGHVKGAFTGAVRDKKGRFELAHGGTIFLDEVGELKPDMQVKLLRVLQDGRMERVGGEKTVALDVRVISATNRNLEEEVARKRFREDLYYRLCVMPIFAPPLRERKTDIPILVHSLLARFGKEGGFGPATVSEEVARLLAAYPWPGNVRELQNVLHFALVKSRGETIREEHLPPAIRWHRAKVCGFRKRGGGLTRKRVLRAIDEAGGNKKQAAAVLGVSRSTLYRFLSKLP